MFEPCFTDSRVLACIAHVLGEFKLSSLNSRAALPGQGHQGPHADWAGPVPAGGYQVCNSIWPTTAATGRAGRCTPTSPAAATSSNWTRRNTSARRPLRA